MPHDTSSLHQVYSTVLTGQFTDSFQPSASLLQESFTYKVHIMKIIFGHDKNFSRV